MIIGTGIDLVDIRRVSRIYSKFGARFLKHVLSATEQANMPAQSSKWLAARFAAKEAAVKALGTGFADGITPIQIEILTRPGGKPDIRLLDRALLRASALGANKWHVSISHERDTAVAMVILES